MDLIKNELLRKKWPGTTKKYHKIIHLIALFNGHVKVKFINFQLALFPLMFSKLSQYQIFPNILGCLGPIQLSAIQRLPLIVAL